MISNKWLVRWFVLLLVFFSQGILAAERAFVHPGMLHTKKDFSKSKELVKAGVSPAINSWKVLTEGQYARANYQPRAQSYIIRGKPSGTEENENYPLLYRDAAAAYQLAVRWKISGDEQYAEAAIRVLDAWANTLGRITGTADKYLAAGLYGYQLANAAEIMRTYSKWGGLSNMQSMLLAVFYPMNHDFIVNHNGHGAADLHYWAGWDLANIASMMAIGILTDRRDLYNEALNYVKEGKGNGAFNNAMWKVYPEEELAQVQESGRDQGHTLLDIALIGVISQMAFNQGDDLFAFNDNLVLKASEYVAKYNLGHDVPWTAYTWVSGGVQETISSSGRGELRPIWTLIYNHYVRVKGLKAPYTQEMMEHVGYEGGGGSYGPNSGGFDQLGFGSLLFNR